MKIKSLIITTCIILTTLSSCGYILVRPVAKKNISKNRATSIPPDFGKDKQEVIVFALLGKQGLAYDKVVQKTVPKYYNGKYVYKTSDQIQAMDEEQREKYRYIFSSQPPQYHTRTSTSNPSKSVTTSGSRGFWILDTKTNKTYTTNVTSGSYGRIMEAYLMNLEQVRLEYQN